MIKECLHTLIEMDMISIIALLAVAAGIAVMSYAVGRSRGYWLQRVDRRRGLLRAVRNGGWK